MLAKEKNKEGMASMLYDKSIIGGCNFNPSSVHRDSSYVNMGLYLILNLSAQIICLILLLPSNIF